jgi:tRNA(fMet)-specific endonuclease VapC
VIADRLRAHGPQDVRLSAITKAELFYGARHSKRVRENVQLVAAFCKPYQCLPFDDICAEHYGLIRADLVSRGENLSPIDLLIAATARAHDLVLVTHNLRDFAPIVGLRLEDWEVE